MLGNVLVLPSQARSPAGARSPRSLQQHSSPGPPHPLQAQLQAWPRCASQPTPTAICSFALFPSSPHNLPITVWETEAPPFQASRGRETPSQLQTHVLRTFAQVGSPHPARLPQGLCSGRGEQVKGLVSELFNVVFGDPGTGTGPCEHCGILVGLGKHIQ